MPTTAKIVIDEHYHGNEIAHLDHMQAVWRRTLRLSTPATFSERLYDAITCIREGIRRALEEGCGGTAGKICALRVTYTPETGLLEVSIDDPGAGGCHEQQVSEGGLGLALIRSLSDEFKIANEGASLYFSFQTLRSP